MRRVKQKAVALAALAFSFSVTAYAQPADRCGADLKGAAHAESAHYIIAYAPKPAPITVAKHFSMDIAVCAKAGATAPRGLRVDALMPEHGHGMNYKPGIIALGKGRFNADGLMLHMPGRWELVFDVQSGDASERVTANLTLK